MPAIIREELILRGTHRHQVLHLMAHYLLHHLSGTLIREAVIHAVVAVVHRIHRIGVGKESPILLPHHVLQEILLALIRDDDAHLRGVESSQDAVATEDEVFRTQCTCTVARSSQSQVDGFQCCTTHKGRVRDGNDGVRHLRTVHPVVLLEEHLLQLRLVLEGTFRDAHRAAFLVRTAQDVRILHRVVHFLQIAVIHEAFVRRRQELSAYHAHLMDIRQDIGTHSLSEPVASHVASDSVEGFVASCQHSWSDE